jgi:GT2 family glycosyltransferase
MIVTTIVPTYNRADSLRRLLASLRSVECPPDVRLEVLVINNGSSDGTSVLLAREQERVLKFSLKAVEESRRGKAAALNRGLAESSGQIVALLDDDVVVHPDWLAAHFRAHRGTRFAAVQGRVLPGWHLAGAQGAHPGRLHEHNVLVIDYGDEFREIRGFVGTNVSFKREVFETTGFFDVRLGPGAAGYSEDTEYARRVRGAGFKIGYAPDAIAYHELNRGRYGRGYNRRAEYRKGLSRAIYRRDSIAGRVVPSLIGNCMRYGVYRLTGNAEKAYRAEGRIMKIWGYLVGTFQRGKAGAAYCFWLQCAAGACVLELI